LLTLDRRVRVVFAGPQSHGPVSQPVMEGEALGVDQNGALLLRLPDGRVERVLAADVTLHEG